MVSTHNTSERDTERNKYEHCADAGSKSKQHQGNGRGCCNVTARESIGFVCHMPDEPEIEPAKPSTGLIGLTNLFYETRREELNKRQEGITGISR